jgi:hypothetical protein
VLQSDGSALCELTEEVENAGERRGA